MSSSAIDHLVSLTALRDREQLDLSLAQSLASLLQARQAGVFRMIQDRAGNGRWLSCGVWRPGSLVTSDPSWVDPESLPLLDEFPLRQEVMETRGALQVALQPPGPEGWLTVLPLGGALFQPGLVEIETDRALTVQEIRQVETLLKVFDNFQRLLDSSQRDALTSLLNRQTFDATFLAASLPMTAGVGDDGTERRRVAREVWWLGVIDIDHFKSVNDRFGHLIGDEVLVLVARIMQQTFRHHDRLFRFGGEEFVVMLRAPDERSARDAFERLRENIECYPFPQVGSVTISIGITRVVESDTPSGAFARADEAVYQAKGRGRNQVLVHEALVAEGVLSASKHEGDVELF